MKEKLFEIYVKKFDFIAQTEKVLADFIPPIQRRRLSDLDKNVLSVLNSTIDNEVQNIVYASGYGEEHRLMKLIEQYTENNEVSPNIFSGSVHNFPMGFFLLTVKQPLQYTALAGGEGSISNGFLASVISQYDNVIFCYADVADGKNYALSVNFSKIPAENSVKYLVKTEVKNGNESTFEDFIKLFCLENDKLQAPLYLIERVDG